MLTLTVQQPWATLLVRGVKRVENRSWDPDRRRDPAARWVAPTWIAIHAGQRAWSDPRDLVVAVEALGVPEAGLLHDRDLRAHVEDLPRSAVLGAVCVDWTGAPEDYLRLWPDHSPELASGPRCWHTADAFELPTPFACSGALGLWRCPLGPMADLSASVLARDRVWRSA